MQKDEHSGSKHKQMKKDGKTMQRRREGREEATRQWCMLMLLPREGRRTRAGSGAEGCGRCGCETGRRTIDDELLAAMLHLVLFSCIFKANGNLLA